MDFVQLTDAQRRAFDENGFLVVRNVLDAGLIEQLIEDADRLMHVHGPGHLRKGVVQEPAFAHLLSHPATVPLVVQLLSPNIHLHTATITYKSSQPDVEDFRGWHRDIGISDDLGHQGLPRVGLKVCYCLTDFMEPSSGITLMAPGSHLLQTALPIKKGALDPEEVVEARLQAGDALFFENRIFHSGAPNRSKRTSKVVFYGYSYRWMKVEDNLFPPDPRLLAEAEDDVDKQLLGGYVKPDTPPQALRDWAEQHGVPAGPPPWIMET
jgi:ectoine hydroxylase-related dioxygenase (phytanoyl-CoA dioxygenase family)